MSDDEMMWDEEEAMEEDGGDGEEGGEEGGEGEEFEWENLYFQAKDAMEDDPKAAIKDFEKIVKGEQPPGEWAYRGLKRLVKLYFTTGDSKAVLDNYQKLLNFANGKTITENDLFKGINKCLDIVSASPATDVILKMYDLSFNAMKGSKSDTTWFKTKLKLAKLLLDRNEAGLLAKTLEELHKSCLGKDGKLDPKKGSNLIDIYSLEIQLALNSKDRKKTKEIYTKALNVAKDNPGILNSRLAIFHFCGGKIQMEQNDWEGAYSSFQEAFRFFEEAGNTLKIPCLKYILLANMLRLSKIDPFNSPETANLKSHKEIAPMAALALAYASNDITQFEKIMRDNKKSILGDPFIAHFINDLMREVRTQVLLEVIKPYTRIKIPFLAKELNVSVTEVESLLVDLILDAKIVGHIDQVQQLLHFQSGTVSNVRKYAAMEKWAAQLTSTTNIVVGRLN
eukprot:Mycagemm_TRINITY_DN10305_c1_g1::TRINITY_DN10305_c1_g1_i1::g.1294::m.1294 type:complete len:452 gc:universal TRINITY_DN10305_c1_g1_i1:46-1401(+)